MKSTGMRVVAGVAVIVIAVVLLIVLKDDGDDAGSAGTSNAPAGNASSGGTSSGGEAGEEGGTDGDSATLALPTVVVGKNGKPVGGIRNLTYKAGDEVHFRVESAVADEIHIHGYDISKDVEAGGSVDFEFSADIEGVFEAELEDRREQIVQLTVSP